MSLIVRILARKAGRDHRYLYIRYQSASSTLPMPQVCVQIATVINSILSRDSCYLFRSVISQNITLALPPVRRLDINIAPACGDDTFQVPVSSK